MTDEQLILNYMDRFINQTVCWGKQWIRADGAAPYAHQKPHMDTKGGRYQYEPVTFDLVVRMLEGDVSCAWAAIDEKRSSKWLCFDSDTECGALDKLQASLTSWNVHYIREGRRSGRDGHLWVLFDKPVPGADLIVVAKTMMEMVRVTGLEYFPKTARGYSQVRAPFSINLKREAEGARGWFDGVEKEIFKQLNWLARQPLNRAEDATHFARRFRPRPATRKKRKMLVKWSNGFNIFDLIDSRRIGKDFVAQCPLCALEGHDTHCDNLRISEGGRFCCVYGGPDAVHKVVDIISALTGGSTTEGGRGVYQNPSL